MVSQDIRDKIKAIADEAKSSGDREGLMLCGALYAVLAATCTPYGLEDLMSAMANFSESYIKKLQGL